MYNTTPITMKNFLTELNSTPVDSTENEIYTVSQKTKLRSFGIPLDSNSEFPLYMIDDLLSLSEEGKGTIHVVPSMKLLALVTSPNSVLYKNHYDAVLQDKLVGLWGSNKLSYKEGTEILIAKVKLTKDGIKILSAYKQTVKVTK